MVNRISVANLNDLLITQYNQDFSEKYYEEKKEMSGEGKRFMEIASSSVELKDGHYHLPLPFRKKDIVMPDNYEMVKQRTLNLLKRFKRDAEYAMEYKTFMEDVLKKGYAERVPPEQLNRNDGQIWYIPHHGVYHHQKRKLRVVFDGTASCKGTSLNKELLQGPDLANTLIGVLLGFRQEQIAFMGDIEAMFYQVQVQREHKDFLRFLWWPDGDTENSLEAYRMKVHLFGAVSSPSIANYALRQVAEDNSFKYDEEVTETINSNFYVDDCLKSVATVEQAIKLIRDLRDACAKGLFKDLDFDRENLPIERALGIKWDTEKDSFIFKVNIKNRALTRRGILSTISSIYDPLGFLSPFILKARQILQELCRIKWMG
ncbi:uncharacterized protein LOC117551795 [Gymnodraco acuticeps]|uniref:Uncharacterized protein LOC117551795 n=1 Tax=Gymnodraco acuticeps TaxID=8218 RepID=A0A6P8UUX6_GYMAC|nr:uncharacterized protein LOC117551795 [Gymnodraco acuticeps]